MTSEILYQALKERIERQDLEIERLRAALTGVASCATKCECCAMHKSIAERVLCGS